MKRPVIALLVAMIPVGPAQTDEAFETCVKSAAAEDTHCGEEWVKREQAGLDATWHQLGEMADGEVAKALAAEQRTWEAFRDVACSFKLDKGFGGAGGPNGFHACRAGVIAARTKALEAYISYIDN
jgi:uncharacterized protein YecT (DUF1311 family)